MSKKQTLKTRIEEQNTAITILTALEDTGGAVVYPAGCTPLPMGLEIDPSMPFDSWLNIATFVRREEKSRLFRIADWLNAGESIYGEKYAQAVAITGLGEDYLMNICSVGRQISLSRRRISDHLVFRHYIAVAKLSEEEQVKWLEIADQEKLTSDELRASIKAGHVVNLSEKPRATKGGGLNSLEAVTLEFDLMIRNMKAKQPLEEWSLQRTIGVRAELKAVVDFDKECADHLSKIQPDNAEISSADEIVG